MPQSDDWRRGATPGPMRRIDPSVAHIARIQDYWLGGDDHFEVDRLAGDEAIAHFPDLVASVQNTRAFLGRTVRFLAEGNGVRQYLDIGTGIPTASNTHEVAQRIAPESRIVYVDNDPMVLAEARSLLIGSDEGQCRLHRRRHPRAGEDPRHRRGSPRLHPARRRDPDGVLQFVPDEDGPHEIVRRLMEAVPRGSYLVISHPAADLQAVAMAGMATRLNQLMVQRVKPRRKDEVTAFFDGLSLVDPGVIRCPEWRPERPEDAAGKSTMWGGVAVK
jgi:hypothetical protein